MQWKLIVALAMAIVVIIFAVNNPQRVSIKFAGWTSQEMPLVLVIFAAVIVGAIISALFSISGQVGLKREIKRLRGQIEEPDLVFEEDREDD